MVNINTLLTLCYALVILAGCTKQAGNMKELTIELGASQEAFKQQVPFRTDTMLGADAPGRDLGALQIPMKDLFLVAKLSGDLSMRFGPVRSFDTFALKPDLNIYLISLTLDSSPIKTHTQAQSEVRNLIAQFQRGPWQRHIPDYCPRVTGRSTVLDIEGNINQLLSCPLDPELIFKSEEWPTIAKLSPKWQWITPQHLATLEVSWAEYTPNEPSYSFDIEFAYLADEKLGEELERKQMIAEYGEAKVAAGTANGVAKIKLLEQAALKRGDKVLPP